MTTRVRIPDRDADRPDAFGLLAVALAALCAGLWVARVMSGLPPNGAASASARADGEAIAARPESGTNAGIEPGTDTSTSALEEAAATEPGTEAEIGNAVEPQAAAPASHEPAHAAAAAPAAAPALAAAPEPGDAPEPSTPPATSDRAAPEAAALATAPGSSSPPRFKLGIVAYDRCDGLPQRTGRFPCPRDLSLEQQVWHALRALEVCPSATAERGAAELRFEFESAPSASSLRVRALPGSSFDRAVVTKCAGLALSSVRTRLLSDHMVVRFRFELR